MNSLTRFALQHPVLVLLIEALITFVLVAGIPLTRAEVGYRIFLGDDHPAIVDLDKMIRTFGGGLPIFIAWECRNDSPCKSVFDDESLAMVVGVSEALKSHPLVSNVENPATSPIVVPVEDDIEVRQLVTDGVVAEDRDELAKLAMDDPLWKGTLVSPDGKVGAMLVQLVSSESRVTAEIVPAIREALQRYEAVGFTFYLVGDPIDFVVSGGQLQADTPIIVAGMLVFLVVAAWILFGSLLTVFLALSTAGLGVGWAMGLMSWLDWPEMEITQALRPGILVIALCTAIHVVTRYAEYANSETDSTPEQRRGWIDKVTKEIGAACLLTSATTAAGFLSFISSGMSSFSQFGITAAVGVGSGLLLSFTALPIILIKFDPRRLRSEGLQRSWNAVLQQIGAVAEQRPRSVFFASGILMLVSVYGWSQLRIDVNERELLGDNTDVVRWAVFLEENLRKADSLEIHLIAPKDRSFLEPEGIAILQDTSNYVTSLDGLGQARSVLDLLSTANRATHGGDANYFHPADSHAGNAQLALVLEMAPGSPLASWISYNRNARISVEADPTSTSKRTVTLNNVTSYLDGRLPGGWTYTLSGPLAVYLAFTDVLQRTQLWSFAFAAGLVSALLWIYFRRSGHDNRSALKWTFVGMFPTALPVVVTLGTMGLFDVPLDVGTAMVGAIILGVAVDDSIHLITAYRDNRRRGLASREAILGAITRTGQALITSSIAISIGFFALMASSWQSIASFGLLSGVAILVALLADLIVLPAIILAFQDRSDASSKPPSTISDIPSFSDRVGTTLLIGFLGLVTLGILAVAAADRPSKAALPCSVIPNGAVSPFSLLDRDCPLKSRDIVHSVEIKGRSYVPKKLMELEYLEPLPTSATYRISRAGQRADIPASIRRTDDTNRTIQLSVAGIAIIFSSFLGLSVLWLSSAQAALPVAILFTSLGVFAAGTLSSPYLGRPPFPFLFPFATIPAAMIHLAMSFPKRSVVLQHAPGFLGLLYGAAGVTLVGISWGTLGHPIVWNTVIFLCMAIFFVSWMQIIAAGMMGKMSHDPLEQHRARVAVWGSLFLVALVSIAHGALEISRTHSIALGLVLAPAPMAFSLVKNQFFDARPYARTVGLFSLSSILYVGIVGIAIFTITHSRANDQGVIQLGVIFLALLLAETVRLLARSLVVRRLPTAGARLHDLELQLASNVGENSSEEAVGQAASNALMVGLASSGVSVALHDSQGWRIVAVGGSPPPLLDELEDLTAFLTTRVSPVYLGPEGGEQSPSAAILRGRKIAVSAPVLWNEKVIGAIFVSPPRDLLPYRRQEINFIQRVSGHAAMAFQNIRATEELLRVERNATLEWTATGLMHSVGRPMTIIARSTQRIAARAGEHSDAITEFIEDVRLASQEVLEGLEQLRSYAATGRLGRNSPQPAEGVVERAVRVALYLHEDAELAIRPAADLPLVFHPEELHRVITSLLDNALHATMPSDPMPEIRVSARTGKLKFEIEDFGCGMAPSVLERAAQAFFTTRRDEGGSGIGLLDAKTTIERIGGNFLLQSVEGRGTTATIVLPAHLSLVPTTPGLDHLQYEPNFRGA